MSTAAPESHVLPILNALHGQNDVNLSGKTTQRNERIPREFPNAATREAERSRVRKLRGVVYLHKTLIPLGSEEAKEEETEKRDGGKREE